LDHAVKSNSLKDLGSIKKELEQAQKKQKELEAANAAREKKALAEKNLFSRAVGAVKPITQMARAPMKLQSPKPLAYQKKLDDQAVLKESLSDEFDATTLLDVDDQLSFRRPGIGLDVTKKLRTGGWSIQSEIDLHGLRRDEAREALGQFIRDAMKMGWRCVRVIHGKGLGSPGKTPVLKAKTLAWLIQKNEVLAFVQAKADQGGAGALLVLLKGAS
jgi:DNA-nicking Smr family endonuclease